MAASSMLEQDSAAAGLADRPRCYRCRSMGASVEDSYSALDAARGHFAEATDFTIGIEEEFQILDRDTLLMTNRFEELRDACQAGALGEHVAGELIASEIEVKTGRGETFNDAALMLIERRRGLAEEAAKLEASNASA